ncbi:MAG: sigma-70 family RNA polymerase sigma factor [Candidatus Sericytochromatia bacterium]|nr:sigma-70 family RNA polymerase sigma factor [Candidatus Sericytochromatia bacterium]
MSDLVPSDRELVLRCQTGDLSAAETLYRRYRQSVHALVWRMMRGTAETEDLVHDVFVRALRGLKTFRGDSSFRTWVLHIATNTVLNHLDRADRAPFAGSLDEPLAGEGSDRRADVIASQALRPEDVAINNELEAAIQAAISRLPPAYRAALILRDVEGLAYDEIAVALDINLGTVKSRIARARAQVQGWLRDYV